MQWRPTTNSQLDILVAHKYVLLFLYVLILCVKNPLTAEYGYTVVFNPFYQRNKSLLLWMECVLKHQDLQMFSLK